MLLLSQGSHGGCVVPPPSSRQEPFFVLLRTVRVTAVQLGAIFDGLVGGLVVLGNIKPHFVRNGCVAFTHRADRLSRWRYFQREGERHWHGNRLNARFEFGYGVDTVFADVELLLHCLEISLPRRGIYRPDRSSGHSKMVRLKWGTWDDGVPRAAVRLSAIHSRTVRSLEIRFEQL